MASSLVRGKYVVCKAISRHEAEVIEDGAVVQRDGRIVDVGPYSKLAVEHAYDEEIGSPDHVVIPGLVNAHHHVGLTPVQLGSLDQPLELWFATRLAARNVDRYLDTLYSAFEMVESGVTTVQHLAGWFPGPLEAVKGTCERIIEAYRDIGMRVSYSHGTRDQNRLVYQDDAEFAATLPAELGTALSDHLATVSQPLEEQFQLFEELYQRYNGEERVRIQLAPVNLHWCSDRALELMADHSERYQAPMHMHLVETAYQKEYARRRGGSTAVDYIRRFGLLGPRLTLGHGVWLTEADIELIAETGTNICHNASSNLRLRSGIAPLNAFVAQGVRVAMGMDEAGINDDRDMLQEMRMVLNLHRTPGMDGTVPAAPQVLRMASEHGAHTTPFGAEIGAIEPGRAADLVVLNWRHIAHPFLDLEFDVSPLDAILLRARAQGVETVLVGGEAIYRDGRFTRLDKESVLEDLAAALGQPLSAEEKSRRDLSRKVLPFVRRFYDGYLDGEIREPFYGQSSRR